jgi:hypothetical protein
MTNKEYFFIEDDSFLSMQEISRVTRSFFDDSSPVKPFWRMNNVMEALERMDGRVGFPYEKTPLAFDSPNSTPLLQMIGDIDLDDFPDAKAAFEKFCDKHDVHYDKILRARVNVLPLSKEDKHHYIHIDNIISHHVFLYYLHDSDGDTLFFNKRRGDSDDNMQIIDRVSPKVGKAIMFDGLQFHSSSPPKETAFRSVLNIDFIMKKE